MRTRLGAAKPVADRHAQGERSSHVSFYTGGTTCQAKAQMPNDNNLISNAMNAIAVAAT